MCFQLANSVSQLGFGHIADRWRPRVLLIAGPLAVRHGRCTLIGLAPNHVGCSALVLDRSAGSAARRFIRPPQRSCTGTPGSSAGLAMSFHITSGTLGQAIAPLVFAPFAQRFGLSATPLLMIPALRRCSALSCCAACRRSSGCRSTHDAAGFRALRPYAQPLTLLYLIVVLRTLTAMSFSTFVPVMLTRRGLSVAQAGTAVVDLSLRRRARRILRRSARRPLRRAARDHPVARRLRGAVSRRRAACSRAALFIVVLAIGGFLLQSTLPVNVTFGQIDRADQRRDGLVADDGLRLGHGRPDRAVRRHARRSHRDRTRADVMSAIPLLAAALAWSASAARKRGRTRRACVGIVDGRKHRHGCC